MAWVDGAWHPTAPVRVLEFPTDGPPRWRLDGLVHARRIGTLAAACGSSAAEWPMLMTEPFDHRAPEACAVCVATLLGTERLAR